MSNIITSYYNMKRFTYIFGLSLAMVPSPTFAQLAGGSSSNPLGEMLRNILEFSNDVLIPFIIGIGFLAFVWGMFQYFILGGSNDESREKGRKLMVSATFAFVIIIVFFGFINMLANSSGLEGETLQNIPEVPIP